MWARQWLRREFGFFAFAVSLLSCGLGASTLLYTALDRLLLHPLTVPHAEEVVRAAVVRPPVISRDWFIYRTYQAMQQMHTLSGVAAQAEVDVSVNLHGTPQLASAQMVTSRYFDLLGAKPALGPLIGRCG